MVKRYQNTSRRTGATSRDYDISHNPGPFIAIVVNNVDPTYMGRLTVVLQTRVQAGDNPEFRENQIVVDYCPPFFGATPIQSLQIDSSDLPWVSGQKSYGMWFVPPEIGAKVLVIFTEGNQGYWIGCIPEAGMNFMTPGVDVATEINDAGGDRKLPTVEYQKNQVENIPDDLTQIPKPVNNDLFIGSAIRGLVDDPTRGFTTASAQRETPSSVFGISTPGPREKRVNPVRENNRVFFNRLGGSSFVMDDGDERFYRKGDPSDTESTYVDQEQDTAGEEFDNTIPHGEMMRFKTRTGHQILMHNSEDLIYIGNSRGTAWVELTSNGKIDIYSQDSVSVHTEADLNFKADRDINFEAGRDFNIKANQNITQESVESFQLIIGDGGKITTQKGNLDVNTKDGNNNFTANENTNIKSGGNHVEEASIIHMNGPSAATADEAEPLDSFVLPGTVPGSQPGEIESILKRMPQREPWLHHENLAPLNFTPEKTDIKSDEPAPESGEYNPTRDTFKPTNNG